jgi:nucleotide-binding universal stress UspA family protein
MQRFKNILVVLDQESRSDALIDRAATLCQRNQARLTIVTFTEESSRDELLPDVLELGEIDAPPIDIIETLPLDLDELVDTNLENFQDPISDPHEIQSTEVGIQDVWKSSTVLKELIKKAEGRQLEQVIALIRSLGVQASGKVLHGTPFIAIIREVMWNGHDLVMITAEDIKGLKRVLFGTTTMHLMRKCPCPVWVMKPDQPKQLRAILAAVDPTPSDEERNTLNYKIMELATSLAHRERCELLVIHTWSYALESHVQSGRVSVPQSKLDEWGRGVRGSREFDPSSGSGKRSRTHRHGHGKSYRGIRSTHR